MGQNKNGAKSVYKRRSNLSCCRGDEKLIQSQPRPKVDEIWRARNEASLALENGNNCHAEGFGAGSGGASAGGTLRWGATRHAPSSSATSVGGLGHGISKGKIRQAKEEQARVGFRRWIGNVPVVFVVHGHEGRHSQGFHYRQTRTHRQARSCMNFVDQARRADRGIFAWVFAIQLIWS